MKVLHSTQKLKPQKAGDETLNGEAAVDTHVCEASHWQNPNCIQIPNKDVLYSTGNSSQCYVEAWVRRSLGENGYVYMYGWVPSLLTWNYHNIVNRLELEYKIKSLIEKIKNK